MDKLSSDSRINELERLVKSQKEEIFQLKYIIDNVPGSIYWKDQNGKYLGVNKFVLQMAGINSFDGIVGKTDYELPWANAADHLKDIDTHVMACGEVQQIEERPTLANGKEAIFLSQKTPLLDENGKTTGVLGISMDITELKRAQQEAIEAKVKEAQTQEEIQRAILTFTGTLSHDLRTPLSTILVVTNLLSKNLPLLIEAYKNQEALNAKKSADAEYCPSIRPKQLQSLSESWQSITEVVKQADAYIDASLKMIKGVASGSSLLNKEDLVACSIEEIIRRVVRTFPYEEGEEEKVHVDTMQSFTFMGNSILMARILQNLIKNAFEQIRQKAKGEIFIWCEDGDKGNRLYLKDTAGGVSRDTIDHLFEGFNSSKKKGTGIGLSSAKQIMKAFSGDIICQLVDGDSIEFVMLFEKIIN